MAIPVLKPSPDERLLPHCIGDRIAELSILPWSKATKRRLDFLTTRLHECPDDIREKGKKAIKSWNDNHVVPRLSISAAPALNHDRLPSNVMAGLLVGSGDEKRGYKYKTA